MAAVLIPSVLSQFALTPSAGLLQTSLQEATLTATEANSFRTRLEEQRIGRETSFFHSLHLLEGRLKKGAKKDLVERGKAELAAIGNFEGRRGSAEFAAAFHGRVGHRAAGGQRLVFFFWPLGIGV